MSTSNVLVIWVETEDTVPFLIKDGSHAAQIAAKCAGKYLNSGDTTEDEEANLSELSELLEVAEKIDTSKVYVGEISSVIQCGWL